MFTRERARTHSLTHTHTHTHALTHTYTHTDIDIYLDMRNNIDITHGRGDTCSIKILRGGAEQSISVTSANIAPLVPSMHGSFFFLVVSSPLDPLHPVP